MPLPSAAKRAANKSNARKTTGPKTEKGKKVSSQNAMRHGLRANDLHMKLDIADDAEEFIKEMRADFQPIGARERQLVAIITAQMWRLRRVVAIETETIDNVLKDHPSLNLAAAFDKAEKLLLNQRYEASIQRAMHRNIEKLRLMQKERREQAPFIEKVSELFVERTHQAQEAQKAADSEYVNREERELLRNQVRFLAEKHLSQQERAAATLPPIPKTQALDQQASA